jgi:UDP-N-acetylglucosamine 2-epimerase (non-hydrolysing)
MMKEPQALKVVTILGTRPEIIRLSRTMALLDQYSRHIIVHTGQNYDPELSQVFFEEMDLRAPDYHLKSGGGSLAEMMAKTLTGTEKMLKEEKPDAVLILGDTNSSIAGLIARRMRIPLYHMEAGNRCFDENVPEEINRKIIDHIADFNLVYTEHARRHLLNEGFPARRIILSGSPMFEVLHHYREKYKLSGILEKMKLQEGGFFLVSLHREENVSYAPHFRALIHALDVLYAHFQKEIIISTHPRTRKMLEAEGIGKKTGMRFLPPFSFFDYVKLQTNAACVLSDSGTISEESAILGFPALTLRRSMERPEALDAGTITLTGFDARTILAATQQAMEESASDIQKTIPPEYLIQDTSHRVLRLILGTARLSNQWKGIDLQPE